MTPLLDVSGVGVRVEARRLLDGVDCELAAGEFVVLIGPNGAGKSTLLRVLIGAQSAESGRIRLLGRALASYSAAARARLITLVPQEQPADFPLRVRELVELGRLPHQEPGSSRDGDRHAVDVAIERTGLGALANRDVCTLSGGERQRASLARALAQRTPVLLLDEPTAHLDIAHQLSVLEAAREQARSGAAVMVALHDLALASRFADRLIVLEGGRVTAGGAPGETLSPERLAKSFGVSAEVEYDAGGRIRHLTVLGRALAGGAGRCWR